MMRWSMKLFAPLCLMTVLLCGCAAKETADAVLHEGAVPLSAGLIYPAEIPLGVQPAAQAAAPAAPVQTPAQDLQSIANPASPAAVPTTLTAEASGAKEKKNDRAVIDYSNTADGYVMVQFKADTEKRLKAQVTGPATTYTYDLTAKEWEVFPLSDGNGAYQVTVFENVADNKYTMELSASFRVELKDEFGPYLYPNQYVDYTAAPNTLIKAAELVKDKTNTLEKVTAVYDYAVKHLTYDYEKARTVTSGYLPQLDSVLAAGKGICFDYASLMAGMLRSQGIPCKLVVGYASGAYHAWINVWTEESGWVDGVIYFDGVSWKRMDPTFASADSNYTAKYLY